MSRAYDLEKFKDLKYGENPHQKAFICRTDNMVDFEILNNQEISYNNVINAVEALNIVSEFYDVNCVAIVRHAKPCGVALGRSLFDAYNKAFDCDPVSSFYGVAAFSKTVDVEVAKHLNSMAVEVVAAPNFDSQALNIFKDNEKIKLIKLNTPLKNYRKAILEEVVFTPFGALVQDKDNSELNKDTFKIVTKTKPTTEQIEDAVFAWKIAKYSKTSSAVVAKDFKTSAISQGCTNEIQAIDYALNYACDNSKNAVLAIDSAIHSEECIFSAIQGRIGLIIQTGGSIKDNKIIELCNEYNIAMITTGIRNYRN